MNCYFAVVSASFAAVVLCALTPAQSRAQTSAVPTDTPAPPRFDIHEFRVDGNSVLAALRIEKAVYPFLGERRTVEDVEAARAALEVAYRDAGYGTVMIETPEQQVVDGVIRLLAVEAPVSRLRVTGAQYFSQGRILDKVPALAEGQVPNFKLVTEQLAGVNRSSDRRVTPMLRPGKETGTTEVDLTVEDKLPLHGSVELNNRASANTTASRLQASLRYDNLWQREHSVGLQVQLSPQKSSEVKVFAASYSIPGEKGLWLFSALRSDSATVAGIGDTTVIGKGSIFGLRYVHLLAADERSSDTLTLGLDYKDFDESVNIGVGSEAPGGFQTPIRYLPFSLNYAATRNDDKGRWLASASLVLALRGLASRETQFETKRFGAQGNFSLIKADLTREHKLAQGWGLTAKVEAQISAQPLIGNEQFVVGGVDSVRGYLEASAVGDNALRGSLELHTPALLAGRVPGLESLHGLAFLDAAYLRLRSPLPKQAASYSLAGVGLGLRAQAGPRLRLSLQAGWPLHELAGKQKTEPRVHASGAFEF